MSADATTDATVSTRMRAWLELMRVSNAPTVLSNSIAGAAVGAVYAHQHIDATLIDARLCAIAAPLVAYVGGMILNDAFDAAVDARERPHRPIPSGRIARANAFATGFACLLGALVLAWFTQSTHALAATLVLVGAVLTYNALHTLITASVLLLALCRAFACVIPMLAFTGGGWHTVEHGGALVLPALLAMWTLGLSAVARGEVAVKTHDQTHARAHAQANALARFSLAVAPIAAALAIVMLTRRDGIAPFDSLATDDVRAMLRTALPFVIAASISVTSVRARMLVEHDARAIPTAVAAWISCLAMFDAMMMFALGQFAVGAICLALALCARTWQRSIAGS